MKVSPSLLAANFANLEAEMEWFNQSKADWLHLDVMDGEFVPNFGLGVDYIRGLRDLTNIPLDLHLMVMHPEYKFNWLGIRKTDIVSIHYESTFQVQRAIDWLKPFGCKVFLAINPATPIYSIEEVLDFIDGINVLMVNPGFAGQKIVPSTINKVERLVAFLKERGKEDLIIEVDGNISPENGHKLKKIGASMFVCGKSSIFIGQPSEYSKNIDNFRNAIS